VGECTAGEHVQQRHQAFTRLLRELVEACGVDTGKDNKRTEAVNRNEEEGDKEALTQVLNSPNVLQCLDYFFHN